MSDQISVPDLALIGAAVLNLASASTLMRHATPVGTTDYAEPSDSAGRIARDFARWCGNDMAAGERLTAYLGDIGWTAGLFQGLPTERVPA